MLSDTHKHTHSHTLNKNLWKICCLLCSVSFSAFPPFHCQPWGEKIRYFKISFQKRLFLKNYAEDEQTTNWEVQTCSSEQKSSEEKWNCKGNLLKPQVRNVQELGGAWESTYSTHFILRRNEDKIDGSLAQSHTQLIAKSVLFSKNTTLWQMEHFGGGGGGGWRTI